MKRLLSVFCVCALLLSAMVGCQKQTDEGTDYSNTSLTGKVTAIENTTATLQLGELAEKLTKKSCEKICGFYMIYATNL